MTGRTDRAFQRIADESAALERLEVEEIARTADPRQTEPEDQ